MRHAIVVAACLAAGHALAAPLAHPPLAAKLGLVAVQATPAPADGGTVRATAPGVTPQVQAEVRGQTTTFTKPNAPVGPLGPQPPRGPARLFVTPGTVAGPIGPQGPQGLPR